MQKIKTLFNQSHDVKPNIHALSSDVNLVTEVSKGSTRGLENLETRFAESSNSERISSMIHDSNSLEFPSDERISKPEASSTQFNVHRAEDRPSTERILVHQSSNSVGFPKGNRRKTPEEIIEHKYEYQREYLKKWRAKKKKDEESMKTINQLAMNALIKIINANSHLIAEEDMNIINSTIDYNDRCTKIIVLINKLYGATT